jgi:hypothetical protein
LIIELTINSHKFTIFRDAQVHVLAQEGAPSRGMVGFHGEPPGFHIHGRPSISAFLTLYILEVGNGLLLQIYQIYQIAFIKI